MKNLQQMLRELAREDVIEFAIASDRLPCVKVGEKYDPVDDAVLSTEEILAMLVTVGGSRYVEELETRPARWTIRVEAVGTVDVYAIMRGGRVQARFSVNARSSERQVPAAPVIDVASSGRMRAAPPASSGRMRAAVPVLDPPLGVSEPLLRGAVINAVRPAEPELVTLDDRLRLARETGASDVHIIAGRPMLFRMAGELVTKGPAVDPDAVEEMLRPLVPERLRPVLAEQGSCDFALDRPPLGRFRVNLCVQRTGLKGCLRVIPPETPTLESLGLPAQIERATHHHQGLVLVTGPTGHGKTSTLAAIVDIINRDTTHHVITVEDPVEYVFSRKKAMISQREVGTHTRSFANALKGSLREDPDVIVVGELRDTETVRMALAASETGHLVLGTMNTPSAAKTIDRLIDLFPPADQQQVRMTLAGGLHLVVGQRLLPAADGHGMAVAAELLTGGVALWSLIRDNKTFQIPSLQQRGKGLGIVRLDESLVDLARSGKVTREAAMAYAEAPEELDAVLAGKRQPPAPPIEPPKRPDAAGLIGKAGQIFGKRGA